MRSKMQDPEVYWLCECGKEEKVTDEEAGEEIITHADTHDHYVEKLSIKENGATVVGFYAGGLSYDKYREAIPESASVRKGRFATRFPYLSDE